MVAALNESLAVDSSLRRHRVKNSVLRGVPISLAVARFASQLIAWRWNAVAGSMGPCGWSGKRWHIGSCIELPIFRAGRPGGPQRVRRTAKRRAFALHVASVLTLFAVVINGYHPGADDGGLYMAGVSACSTPSLYPHATAFVLEAMRHSFFAPPSPPWCG